MFLFLSVYSMSCYVFSESWNKLDNQAAKMIEEAPINRTIVDLLYFNNHYKYFN